jgi:hypothetical protein
MMRGSGRQTHEARAARRPFVHSGAALIFGLKLHRQLNLVADAEVGFPWVRDSVLFEGQPFHATRAAFGSASVGIEVLFGDR